jgi:hypothetical protein
MKGTGTVAFSLQIWFEDLDFGKALKYWPGFVRSGQKPKNPGPPKIGVYLFKDLDQYPRPYYPRKILAFEGPLKGVISGVEPGEYFLVMAVLSDVLLGDALQEGVMPADARFFPGGPPNKFSMAYFVSRVRVLSGETATVSLSEKITVAQVKARYPFIEDVFRMIYENAKERLQQEKEESR